MPKKNSTRRSVAKSAESTTTDKSTSPKSPNLAEDNPRRRFEDTFKARRFGSDKDGDLANLRASAISAARALSPFHESNLTPVTPGGNNWVELGPTGISNGQTYGGARVIVTGRVTEIAQHPTNSLTLYVAASRGGVWKSADGGVTWTPKSDHAESLAIGALALARSNPQTLYAGTGEGDIYYYRLVAPLNSVNAAYEGVGVLKSTNGGDTWVRQGAAQFTGACFYKMAVDPTNENIAFGATNLGLYRTLDGGMTWVKLTSGLPAISSTIIACCDIVIHPTNPNIAYCAFWADGIYKTINATAGSPTWSKLAGGFPTTNLSRIALAISPTAPNNVYALTANSSDKFGGFFTSANDGSTWSSVSAASAKVRVFGAYTLNVFVDTSTPDIVYLSGVELYKAVRTGSTWSVNNIGRNIHPDNHAFAGHTTNNLIVYAGNDGGIYKSTDGGANWDDTINEGINITQFEFLDLHPTSDAEAIAGTQDNGTQMFRNHPAFYHSADGDGGQAGIDASNPNNVIHTYYFASPERSTQGGKFGSYSPVDSGLSGASLFYPPFAYDETNSQNIAFGTDRINLDPSQGTGGWPTKVSLPGITGLVSAIHYVNSNLIYAATSSGEVYRLVKTGQTWAATAINDTTLPARWIWDIATIPGDTDTVIVVLAGFGTPHVWRGTLTGSSFSWANISGTAPDAVPDVPINSLSIDPVNPTHFYVGTDIGVFRTTNAGTTWQLFNDGLPNTAIYDLRLQANTRLLRAATHGRGLWERQLDVASMPDSDLYLRDHAMSTARILPAPSPVTAPFEDPLQHVSIGDQLWWWQCADVKIDAPASITHTYQMPVADVDYFALETKLEHRNPQRGKLNRVYLQVHNRGIKSANNVTVKILYADASPGPPDLPSDFWSAFPGDGTTTSWHPIGSARVIQTLSPKRPEVLEWDWTPPMSTANHSCLLIVVDCPDNPIPEANKVLDIGTLVTQEKRVGLKNLHVIDALPGPLWSEVKVFGKARGRDSLHLSELPQGWALGLLIPEKVAQRLEFEGLKRVDMTKAQTEALEKFLGRKVTKSEVEYFYAPTSSRTRVEIRKIPTLKRGFPLLFMWRARQSAKSGSFTIIQRAREKVIGGSTFILREASK